MNKFNHKAHRELWLWLADHPGCQKEAWPRWEHNGGDIKVVESFCFACEYNSFFKNGLLCPDCPFVWGNAEFADQGFCQYGEAGEWESLMQQYGQINFVNLATHDTGFPEDLLQSIHDTCVAIANLPVREGVECIE